MVQEGVDGIKKDGTEDVSDEADELGEGSVLGFDLLSAVSVSAALALLAVSVVAALALSALSIVTTLAFSAISFAAALVSINLKDNNLLLLIMKWINIDQITSAVEN